MNIVNVCAVNSGGIVYPWNILLISVPGVSITDFFFSKVEPELRMILWSLFKICVVNYCHEYH